MKTKINKSSWLFPLIVLCLSLAILNVGAATATVTVNAATVLKDAPGIGINTDYWMDDQALRAGGARPFSTALSDMGTKFLRYPGGEKSDGYLWSVPPFTAPNPKLARISSEDWPSNDAAYWTPVGDPNGNWSRPIYDFDEFMADCIAVGGTPVIQIAYDGIYKPAYTGGVSLTYQEALDTAVAWVQYANITKGYNIKYWVIGNELWNPGYMGADPGATQYGLDVAVFAQAMRAVDPTILIGITAKTTAYFDDTLVNCKQYVNFLDIHSYPCWPMRSFGTADIEFDEGILALAQASIDKLAEPYKSNLFITCTETGAATYAIRGSWIQNDLGHAINNTEIFLDYLVAPNVKFVQLWNSRWIDNNINTIPHEYDALNPYNNLHAVGLSMKMIGNNLLDKMVATTCSASKVFTYASYSPGKVNVFLINKDAVAYTTTVTLQNCGTIDSGAKVVLKSNSGLTTDLAPVIVNEGSVAVANNQFTVTLNPVTINVIQLVASGGDTQAPTAPTNLTATAVSSTQINLSWTASTDNVGVTGYQVFRGGVQVGTSATTSYSDTGLSANTTYSYYVKAYDAAGNVSAASNTAQATTFTAPTPSPSPTPTPSPIPTPSTSPTPSPGSSTVMHVQDMWTCDVNGNPKTVFLVKETIYWKVMIFNGLGSPVSGAEVEVTIIKPDGSVWIASQKAITATDGIASFSRASKYFAGTFTIRVVAVLKTGLTYDPAANVKTVCYYSM